MTTQNYAFINDVDRALIHSASNLLNILSSMPESQGWTLATCYPWNPLHHFSAIDAPEIGFNIRHKRS